VNTIDRRSLYGRSHLHLGPPQPVRRL